MDNNPSSSANRFNQWARRSVTFKLFTIGLLLLLLLIPATMLISLIRERENIRDQAVQEVSAKWGLDQTIAGPVISVPYETVRANAEGKLVSITGYAHFLPDKLDVEGMVNPEKRYRGIYVVVLYNTQLRISGHFGALNAAALNVPVEDLQWEDALFTIGISDMGGIQSAINLRLNDSTYAVGPGTVTRDLLASGGSVPINLRSVPTRLDFSYTLDLNGSSSLSFTPFGKENNVSLTSNWPNPSFEGEFLPDERTVTSEGFKAQWKVLQLNRNYPQQGEGSYIGGIGTLAQGTAGYPNTYDYDYARAEMAGGEVYQGDAGVFGVRLLLPVDEYQKTMRSAKYAIYFVIITFLTFFFIEVLNRRRLHPIQYLLIGAAVILFYVLLLSISEHMSFNAAYLISCLIILVLITTYSYFILRNVRLTALVAGILTVLYGFYYSLLQLQDYALLLGSFGLLAILATIMYLTRNINWYQLDDEPIDVP